MLTRFLKRICIFPNIFVSFAVCGIFLSLLLFLFFLTYQHQNLLLLLGLLLYKAAEDLAVLEDSRISG